MRKIKVVKELELYKYEELSSEAKEKAKKDYLDNLEPVLFTDMVETDLKTVFPNSDLKVQYSLNYYQGDGLSVYGSLDFEDIFNILKGDDPVLIEGIDPFSEKEIKILRFYANEIGGFKINENPRYLFFCEWDYNFADDWVDTFESDGFSSVQTELIFRFEKAVKIIMCRYCKKWEDAGYDFFYEVEDDAMKEMSEGNDWEYLGDGTLYVE